MSFAIEKGSQALRLYRHIMKLHIRNMPVELRYFGKQSLYSHVLGDLYVKQEFRLHLDKATDDQMDKFLVAWQNYAKQIEKANKRKPKELKKILVNDDIDNMLKDKVSKDQFKTLSDFKDLIYENEKKNKTK